MKNTFEAIYQKHAEIKARFQAAKAEKNAEAMEQVRTEHQRLEESIELKGVTFAMMYDLYKSARERGNKHIDISECYEYRNEAALIADFRECGIDTFTYGSLGAGILTGAFREVPTFQKGDPRDHFYPFFKEPHFSKVMKVLEVMDEISAQRDNVPLAQIALNWNAQKEFVSSCIVGAQHRRKVEQNSAAFDWSLTAEEMAKLDAAIAQYLTEEK